MNEDYCLWMGDLDPTMNESKIRKFFKFYNIYPLAIKLIKEKVSNQNKNYCFIYFKSIFEANNTLNKLKGKPIPNTTLSFKLNWANSQTPTTKIVFVGNLNPLIDEISLFNFFKSKYKSVVKTKIIKENGKSKRYGFVTFKKENDYRKSLIEMDGVFFEGTNIKVKEYIKKDEDETIIINKANKNTKNIQNNLNDSNNANIQLELNNNISNFINNNERQLNTNNLNSNSFLSILNPVNKLNLVSNVNQINGVNKGIKHNNNVNIYNLNYLFNRNINSNNNDKKINNINVNNSGSEYLNYIVNEIDCNWEYNNLINNNINKGNKNNNNNIKNNNEINESKYNKKKKLEILDEFDEKTIKIKINESLNKAFEYYKEKYLINRNRVVCKLILYLILI